MIDQLVASLLISFARVMGLWMAAGLPWVLLGIVLVLMGVLIGFSACLLCAPAAGRRGPRAAGTPARHP
jgi:hypothetical protein